MARILGLTLGVGKWQATIGLFVITAFYSALSGSGAVFALQAVGGLARRRGGKSVW